ncbi:hypothetical protein CGMCC3_g9326 [Colletotrichum fructicola]|uniref:Uncharacterized protein n=1 Tax=Colletotrichum fructicola (strain Nara gc5) TaxID=1213859 RepID=A0A7J6JPQ3_COLFN|nr:uncharacterized protein CGMCC3_g9326 [Colletotrichum fructicola]KAE9574806.1 hypothetical protein CGMCC3_g9326 [Colletotrichum fructicola]KAF4492766.1 hypothetical protein CGGC5_v000373 [Colletotrichum fructicola Nara gc5]
MIVIPALYHEPPEAEWPFSININTVIALLTTLMRATMLVAVAEVIGQMKWRFFDDQQRPLADLQHFDRASRGVLGSVKIIWVARSSFVTVVAALVMVTSVAVGPFTQQAVSTVPCSQAIPGLKASLPISHYVPGRRSKLSSADGVYMDADMRGAMINGLVNPTSNDNSVQPICETGNCTFPSSSTGVTHSSIGMCSLCFDTTSFVSVQDEIFNTTGYFSPTLYALPNNQFLEILRDKWFASNATNLEWAKQSFPAGFKTLARIAFANVTILSFTQAPCTREKDGTMLCPRPVQDFRLPYIRTTKEEASVMAVSCTLYPCLRNYHAEVTRGKLVERIISTEPVSRLNSYDFKVLQLPCFVDGVEYDLGNISQVPHADSTTTTVNGSDYRVPETCLYRVGRLYGSALSKFLQADLLRGYCRFPSSLGGMPDCQTQWWLAPLYHNLTATFDSVSDSFEQLAVAITTQFRITGSSNETFSLTGYREAVFGSVLGTTVCTRFDWQWVLLPITLVFATAILLIFAVAQSWTDPAVPVWKTSILPLLLYNKVESSHDEGMPTLDLDELQKVAETAKAKFQTRTSARIEGDLME